MTVLAWVHPVAAGVAIALAAYAASLGVRSRRAIPSATHARRRHRALGPWVYALVLVAWAGGLASVVLLRPDVEPAASGHFTVGTAVVALFSAAAGLSRYVPTHDTARRLHPLVAAAALVLCGVQVFLGLQIVK